MKMKTLSLTKRELKLICDALENQDDRAHNYGIFTDKEVEEFRALQKKIKEVKYDTIQTSQK